MTFEPLFERDFLPLQVGDGTDRAVLAHDDCLALRGRRLVSEVDEGAPALCAKIGGVSPTTADVDGLGVERLQKLRPAREFPPLGPEAEGLERRVQAAAGLEQQHRAVFLVADAQDAVGPGGLPVASAARVAAVPVAKERLV